MPVWKRLLKALRLHLLRDAVCVVWGWLRFRRTGKTPPSAHGGLVSLYCETGGVANDVIHRFIARRRPPLDLEAQGVLGHPAPADLEPIAATLRARGYYVFPQKLPAETCDRLLRFALDAEATVKEGNTRVARRYERAAPRGVRYDFSEATILGSDATQELMADRSILAVAQAYLGCEPILDLIAMWWHTSWSKEPDKDAAQFFHFDMDRIKWLKFFFYVTDVGPENGPHTFVAGSHRTKGIPRSILRKGQVRIDDDEVLRSYRAEDIIEFHGPRGTIIAEDTRGLHKGRHVAAGDRLVFQLEFSDSLFGADYGDPVPEGFVADPALQQMIEHYPGVYRRFTARRAIA